MTEGSYRSGAETQTRSEVHCGQPMIELNDHRACGKCGGFFRLEKGKLHAVDQPDGLVLEWQPRGGVECRILAEQRLSPAAAWIARLLGSALMFVGAVTAASLLRDHAMTLSEGLLLSVSLLLSGALACALSTRWAVLRTSCIDVASKHLDVWRGALRWGSPTRLQRAGTELRVQLVPGHSAQVVLSLRWPRQRNRMSWPTSERYQVQLVSDAHEPSVLLDQLPSFAAAERARLLVARVLAATAPPWRVDTRAEEDRDDEPLSTTRTSRARRR